MTKYQVYKMVNGSWVKVWEPAQSKLEAELAAAEWLPGQTTKIELVDDGAKTEAL
jgi:hypothetical protein